LAGRQKMISALERLKRAQEMPSHMPETLVAFGISGGLKQGLMTLMASHPPLEDRINALRNAA
jgi:heat shock protein HtpX